MRITKESIGLRAKVNFGCWGIVEGVIDQVSKGIVTFRYFYAQNLWDGKIIRSGDGWTAYVDKKRVELI